ncbi:MFS transporter [Francisella philomiragia]|uniref:Major Facilitator Superfamily protein n=2 Tax=Francisella philomiragia TaxID=28110 RepID=A0AAW3DBQ4_9GAMM|nr:MFS transporter [Francisella philomiragia]KFJ43429.1 major Facilitator Superfamily protein [Francisella philomiragia]
MSKKIFLILIWLSAVAFYMYTRMINTSLSAFSIPLINQYGFSSIDIAFAISIYSIAMLIMKIPVGVIVDRYGIDIPVMIAMTVVLVGTTIFAFPINSAILLTSRFIIGIGTAFAMMSAYRLTSIILSKRLFAVATGFIYFFGSLAVSISGAPLNYAVKQYNYTYIVLTLAGIMLVILMLYSISRFKYGRIPRSDDIKSFSDYFAGIKDIFKDRQIIFTILYASLFTCVFFNTIGYWGNTILLNTKLDSQQAGLIGNSIASLASGIASIVVGLIIATQFLKRSHIFIFTSLASISVIMIFYTNISNIYILSLAALFFGIGFGFTGIVFDTANKRKQSYLVSILSLLFLVEYILNSIINPLAAYIQKTLVDYDFATFLSYKIAYGLFLGLLIIANILSFYIKPQKI